MEHPSTGDDVALKVDVLVDLQRSPTAGGHARCWERLAEAAVRLNQQLDLTIHFSGNASERLDLSPHVRYLSHPPVFSTARLPFLSHIPDHTDLAPRHPGIVRALADSRLIHTTDAYFAFARSAMMVAQRRGVPLVNSVHTDTPRYARVYTAETIRRLFGPGALSGLLLDRFQLDRLAEQDMAAKLARYQDRCTYALVSRSEDLARLSTRLGPERAGLLRRGIDCWTFDPARRDRGWLASEFGIAEDRVVVLFVGRLSAGKAVLALATAVRALIERGLPVHLLCAGVGSQQAEVEALLGAGVSCPGVLNADRLGRAYASADIFAMPSRIEVFANAVMEALASGLPALVSDGGGMGRVVRNGVTGFVIPDDGPEAWSAAIAGLVLDSARRQTMAAAARESALRELPSWDDVLREDLLPVWRRALG